jgi:hypothetical protein
MGRRGGARSGWAGFNGAELRGRSWSLTVPIASVGGGTPGTTATLTSAGDLSASSSTPGNHTSTERSTARDTSTIRIASRRKEDAAIPNPGAARAARGAPRATKDRVSSCARVISTPSWIDYPKGGAFLCRSQAGVKQNDPKSAVDLTSRRCPYTVGCESGVVSTKWDSVHGQFLDYP